MGTDAEKSFSAAGVVARDWGWRHASRKDFALRHVDFTIQPGERVLLLGASGAGKSLHSEALLIRSPRLAENDDRLTILSRRLQGVITAQRYVLMDYDIPVEKVSAAVAITPGFESPTVSPLHDKQWAAVRVVVPKAKVNQLMDQLYEVGARGIIVTALQASRM